MKGIGYFYTIFLGTCFIIVLEESMQENQLKDMYKRFLNHYITNETVRDTVESDIPILEEPLNGTSDKRICKEGKTENVVFLKTHKTGSSTITNIMNRYADIYDLTMLLPLRGLNRFDYPRKFQLNSVDSAFLQSGKKANMLTNHARMHKNNMQKVMQPNTKYITLLRDPVTQFESSFYYLEFDKQLHLTYSKDPLLTFLQEPESYYLNLMNKPHDPVFGLLQNGMLYDLGFEHKQLTTTKDINDAIKKVEEEFDLVLITEYFDESLVLLMRKFCWTFDDILYLKQNVRAEKLKKVSSKITGLIKKWNEGDYKLYQAFNETLWRKIEVEGPSFWKDLDIFREKLDMLKTQCKLSKSVTLAFQRKVPIYKFQLSNETSTILRPFCKKLLTVAIDYVSYFHEIYDGKFKHLP